MNENFFDVVIVGGGAAGMMAAVSVQSKNLDKKVLLIEKNSYLGAKVLISGGGRCNVTTGIFDAKKLLENYQRGAKFLRTAMYAFSPKKVMEWFEEHGVRLKIEEDLRVFPVSNQGKDVVGALESELRQPGVKILFSSQVIDVQKKENGFALTVKSASEKTSQTFFAKKIILTTGGNAYRQTGSTGDGYAFAKNLGHTITKLKPSLSAFLVQEKWISSLAGISIPKASFLLKSFSGKSFSRTGAFLFTHRGVSGPAIFALSAMSAYEPCDIHQPLHLKINFFPDFDQQKLKEKLRDLAQKHGKKTVLNFLDFFLPKSLCPVFIEMMGISSDLQVARMNREHIQKVLNLMQSFEITLIGRTAGEEFVTAGGVNLDEVNPNMMESKICPGLFFAGEILDIDGFTGGFNLQAAWATGKLAGESV